jgi:hypothetical protein
VFPRQDNKDAYTLQAHNITFIKDNARTFITS